MNSSLPDSVLSYIPATHTEVDLTAQEREIAREINQRVAATSSIVELIDFVFDRIRTCLPCDRIGLAFLEENGARLVTHYDISNYSKLWLKKGFYQDMRGSSLEVVIREGRPRIINDLQAYFVDHPKSVSTKLILLEGILSSLTCPLIADGRAIGVLFFSAQVTHAYDEQHVQFLLSIAERLAQAAEKAYRIEQLENANRAYMEMLGFVAHELKNPVASMVTNARLIVDGYLGDVVPEQREKIERIISKGEYLIGLVGDYLNLAQVENSASADKHGRIDDFVAAVVEPAVDLLREQIEASGMVFERQLPATPCVLSGDPALLRIVVVNLLSNAVKYGKPGGLLRMSLSDQGKQIEFTVWNEGPGFPPEKQNDLFRRFSRLNTPELMQQKGTGIGLYTCWKIVNQHGGRIWARSEHGAWASFHFALPKVVVDTTIC